MSLYDDYFPDKEQLDSMYQFPRDLSVFLFLLQQKARITVILAKKKEKKEKEEKVVYEYITYIYDSQKSTNESGWYHGSVAMYDGIYKLKTKFQH